MSRRRALMRQWKKLGEVREIVSSMKSLAFMETRRLSHFLDIQRQVVRTMEGAAADFLQFYPQSLPRPQSPLQPRRRVFLLLGSERGFCGNFNDSLVAELQRHLNEPGSEIRGFIACGQKLCNRLEGHPGMLAGVDGAAVLDEVGATLNSLVSVLTELQSREGALGLGALYHDPEQERIALRELLPPFQQLPAPGAAFTYPPQINLAPGDFLLPLVDHYLFAALHEMLYVSLMAENQQRMQHLEGAVRYLDENLESLRRRGNQLRQEEITEEIEVILLSSDIRCPPGREWSGGE